ncbi:uncharacterized protein METZ01_LOCUS391334, partial [marine metagenome]
MQFGLHWSVQPYTTGISLMDFAHLHP